MPFSRCLTTRTPASLAGQPPSGRSPHLAEVVVPACRDNRERGDDGVATIKELTDGLGAHSVIEAVGTQEAMMQAIRSTRPGGHVGYVGVSHDVSLPGDELFFSRVHLHGGPAPVRRFLPELIDLIWHRRIDPGKVFDLTLPLDEAAEGYRAMDERRAIKTLLRP